MAARKRTVLRLVIVLAWMVLALIMVGTSLAQDGGEGTLDPGARTAEPEDLDDIAVRLAPLLVGAALIERTLEVLFTLVERGLLDATSMMNSFANRFVGLVQVDFREAWESLEDLTNALMFKQTRGDPALEGDSEATDPHLWPLALLEARLLETRNTLVTAQKVLQEALKSPDYVARKKVAAAWMSVVLGLLLAVLGDIHLLRPLGVNVAGFAEGFFNPFDIALAGILMGLGTEWVHQVIGILIKGKGLLGRAATGEETQFDPEQVRILAELAINEELKKQFDKLGLDVPSSLLYTSGETDDSELERSLDESGGEERSNTAFVETSTAAATSGVASAATAAVVESAAKTLEATLPLATPARESIPLTQRAPTVTAVSTSRDTVRLFDTVVTARLGGADVYATPDARTEPLGTLPPHSQHTASAVTWRGDGTWLQVAYEPEVATAWIRGEETDFARSAAYDQLVNAWAESSPVLAFRQALVRDMLRVRGADADRLATVETLSGEELIRQEDLLTHQTMVRQYLEFWQLQEHLGLPDPFEYLPVQPQPPHEINRVEFRGFGPNTFAYHNWQVYYKWTRGLHNGVDLVVPEGQPLIAVADGVIVDFRFLPNFADESLALRPYLPERFRKPDGSRVLSNLIVGYGHLTGDPTSALVGVGDEVRAGQIIGTSGWPVFTASDGSTSIQHNNAFLHVETHLVTDGKQLFGSRTPFNPLLFWTPRLIAWHARLASHANVAPYPQSGQPFGRLGLFSVGAFSYTPRYPRVWEYRPEGDALWPKGVYDMPDMVDWLYTFDPYPAEGVDEI